MKETEGGGNPRLNDCRCVAVIVAKKEKSGRRKVIFTQNQLHKNVGMMFINIQQELTAKD